VLAKQVVVLRTAADRNLRTRAAVTSVGTRTQIAISQQAMMDAMATSSNAMASSSASIPQLQQTLQDWEGCQASLALQEELFDDLFDDDDVNSEEEEESNQVLSAIVDSIKLDRPLDKGRLEEETESAVTDAELEKRMAMLLNNS
jgi:hypothetical protein